MEENKYIVGSGQYFSGQGIVSFEYEGKIYDLGNCTNLTFYNSGIFELVWEKYGQNTLNLLLGDYQGEQEVKVPSTQEKVTLHKFVISKDFSRKGTIHFEGVNTADSQTQVIVKANVTVKSTESLELINDVLASNITVGTWDDAIEFYQQEHTKPDVSRITISSCGKFMKVSDAEKVLKDFYFDPYELSSVIDTTSDRGISCQLQLKNQGLLNYLPISAAEFLKQYNSTLGYYAYVLERNAKYNDEHQESRTGLRLTDYKYTNRKQC